MSPYECVTWFLHDFAHSHAAWRPDSWQHIAAPQDVASYMYTVIFPAGAQPAAICVTCDGDPSADEGDDILPMREQILMFYVSMYATELIACGSVRAPNVDIHDANTDVALIDANDSNMEASEFLSCQHLPMTCGADGKDSCCNSPKIPGGTYRRSFDNAGDDDSGNTSFPATLSDFRLDKYEVTVGRFRAFVSAGMGTQTNPPLTKSGAHANIIESGWNAEWNTNLVLNTTALIAAVKCDTIVQPWTDTPGDNEDRPMNCVTWYEAMAFCAWDGGYLPTEAEWNYAASGGEQQRAYPWSIPAGALILDGSHASYFDGNNCIGDGMPDCTLTDLVAVGSKPAGDGRWGQSDLAGNVAEWTLDWAAVYASTCTDCANLAVAAHREFRGGSLDSSASSLRTGTRAGLGPSSRISDLGIRCARSASSK